MQAMIDKGVTQENVGAFRELVLLSEHMEDRNSERAFATAFVALQSDLKAVKATRPVPNNDGTTRYMFAPYEELMRQVGPILQQHGFTVSFSNDFKEGRLIEICTLQHTGGAKRVNSFAVRIGSGPPKATETQADGAAATYAKRFALCDALNIVVERLDDDARAEGSPITEAQAEELQRRVAETNSNELAFLKLAGVTGIAGKPTMDHYRAIMSTKYAMLDGMLAKKERQGN